MTDSAPLLNWTSVNTGVLLAALAFLWRQSRVLDQLRQAVLGLDAHGGLLADIAALQQQVQALQQTIGGRRRTDRITKGGV